MEGVFETAMRGFKKSDVLNYIDKKETEHKQREEQLLEEKAQISAQLETARKESQELSARVNMLETQLNAEKKKNEEIASRLKAAEDEVELMNADFAKAEELAGKMGREVAAYKQKSEEISAELIEKSAEVEQLKATIDAISISQQRISRVMVEAQNTADKILENARLEAICVIRDAEKRLSDMLVQSKGFAGEVDEQKIKVGAFSGALETLSAQLREYRSGLEGGIIPDGVPREKPCNDDGEKAQKGVGFNFSSHKRMFNWEKP